MIFEYVASGLSFTFKNTFNRQSAPDLCDKIKDMTNKMIVNHPSQKYGVLFNAYTERSTVHEVVDMFGGFTIQADSGGLQLQTLGHGTITERSGIHDMESKYFDPEMLESCAIESGKNLARQIEYFIECGTTAKPLMIIQGNDMDTYMQWTDIIMKQVPQKHWKYIAGISSSSFSLGNGFREDVERAFTLSQLQVPDHIKKHVHLLGVGAMNRLIPAIQFRRSGLFTDDMLFSYDSTKHTGGVVRGQYQEGPAIVQMSRTRCPRFHKAYERINKYMTDALDSPVDEDDFYLVICRGNGDWNDKYGSNTARMFERNVVSYGFLMYSVDQTMSAIEKMTKDEKFISKISRVNFDFVKGLSSIASVEDYKAYLKDVGRHLPSKSVMRPPQTLEEFF